MYYICAFLATNATENCVNNIVQSINQSTMESLVRGAICSCKLDLPLPPLCSFLAMSHASAAATSTTSVIRPTFSYLSELISIQSLLAMLVLYRDWLNVMNKVFFYKFCAVICIDQ